jgi:uncharacterized surface anchored protein
LADIGVVCDADDGANDGTIKIPVQPGWVYLTESRAPAGYQLSTYSFYHFVTENGPNEVTVANETLQTLTVFKVDENGEPLSGVCFELYDSLDFIDEDQYILPIATACDADDGASDGTTIFTNVPPQYLWLVETVRPTGYARAKIQPVIIRSDRKNEVAITNVRQQTLTVYLVDEQGNPLTTEPWPHNVCFALYFYLSGDEDWAYIACDNHDGDNDGTIVFPAVDPGAYLLVQFGAPEGYAPSDSLRVDVAVGHPTQVTIVNTLLAETPPATATYGPTATPTEELPSVFPTATNTDGVLALPSTGVGSAAGSGRDTLQILTGIILLVLLGVLGWLHSRCAFDGHG